MTIQTRVKKPKQKYKYKLPKGQYLRKFNQYDEKFPEIAYDILKQGGCQEDIMADLQVCKETFYRWKGQEADFADAIRAGQVAAVKWHRDFSKANLTNRNYNERAHGRLLRMSYNISEDALAPLPELKKAITSIHKSQVVLNAIADGKITPKQGFEIGQSILNDVKADEATKLKQDIEELKAQMIKGT